jgi:hypothetical protein
MSQKVLGPTITKISAAGGYFAPPGSNPPKAGAFAPRKQAPPSKTILTLKQVFLQNHL